MKLFGEISKTEKQDDGTIKVWGWASTESVDSDGEVVTPDAMKAALPDYMKFGAVREMHQAKAAGTAIEAEVNEEGKTWFGAHVVDSEAVKKVINGVYKGFSIGGKVTERDNMNKSIIKGLKLVEISLVDRPANPDAVFTMYKADDVNKGDEGEGEQATQASADAPAGEGESANPAAEEPVVGDDAMEASKAEGAENVSAVDQLAEMLNKGEITPERLLELAKYNDNHDENGRFASGDSSGGSGGKTVMENKIKSVVQELKSATGIKRIQLKRELAQLKAERREPVRSSNKAESIDSEISDDEIDALLAKQDGSDEIAKYAGEEISDVATALNALSAVMYLYMGEQMEATDPDNDEPAEQLTQLRAVIDNLKAFISSEITEETIEAGEGTGDLAKAGATFSKATKAMLGDIHKALMDCSDRLEKCGYKDAEGDADGDEAGKAAEGEDLAKVAEDLDMAKAEISKLTDALTKAQSRVTELESKPAGKAVLKTVEKAEDVTTVAPKTDPILKSDGSVDNAATLIKGIHAQGSRKFG